MGERQEVWSSKNKIKINLESVISGVALALQQGCIACFRTAAGTQLGTYRQIRGRGAPKKQCLAQ